MSKETTTVKILGTNYKIACPPEEAEEVQKAAVFLDSKLSEIKKASGYCDRSSFPLLSKEFNSLLLYKIPPFIPALKPD